MSAIAPIDTPIRALSDTAAALRSELAEFALTGPRGRQCARSALAVALATTAALALRVDSPWWAAISAFVSLQATAPASLRRGGLRILGTALGAAFALLLGPWLLVDPLAMSLALLTISAVGVLGLQVSGHGYAWLLGAVTADMVWLASLDDPSATLEVACNRTAEVTVGTLAAIFIALVLAKDGEAAPAPAAAPGWSDIAGAQWPAVEHALRAGLGVMLAPYVWSWLQLPSLSQSAITVAAVMATAVTDDPAASRRKIVERALHRILGCLLGGLVGLACLALSLEGYLPWLVTLIAGIWIAAHVQGSRRGIGYVGTQGAVVFITMLVQGSGPPTAVTQGLDRFAGITGGLLILFVVSLATASSGRPGAAPSATA
jgi:uncharacterized membrane protein YccC